mgnify:CR=1 FL=1
MNNKLTPGRYPVPKFGQTKNNGRIPIFPISNGIFLLFIIFCSEIIIIFVEISYLRYFIKLLSYLDFLTKNNVEIAKKQKKKVEKIT